MAEYAKLNKACNNFQESLNQLQSGAIGYEENTPMEKEILDLKETVAFITSKVNLIEIEAAIHSAHCRDIDIEKEKEDVINTVIDSKGTEKALQNIAMGHALKSVVQDTSEDSDFLIYKQKIMEQLELLKSNHELIKQMCQRKAVLNELSQVHIIDQSNEYKEKLKERALQYQKECSNKYTNEYKQQMEKVNDRIKKINFMRIVIRRLLIYSNTNCKGNHNFREILKSTDAPISLDSLLKE